MNGSIEPGTKVYTDEHSGYNWVPNREVVRHGVKEYVREQAHTNGIESFWSMLKRGYMGTYHQMSVKHLDRYGNEFSGRHNGRTDRRRLQKARPHLIDRIVATREDDVQTMVFRRQCHEIAERITRSLFEQALNAFDQDDLTTLCREDRGKRLGSRLNLPGVQRRVDMGMGEFLHPEAEDEVILREKRDNVLTNCGLPAACRPGYEYYLDGFQCAEHVLHETGALQVTVLPDRRADSAEDRGGVLREAA